MRNKISISIYVTPELKKKIAELARLERRTTSRCIEMLIKKYIRSQNNETKN